MNENFFKTEAVVLSTNNFGDSHKVVTFFTREFGKIDANAYNCRRINNPLSGAMQMFNHISLEFIKSNPYKVHEADLIDFQNISEDLDKLTYSSIFFEIVNKMTTLEQVDEKIFNLLINFLRTIKNRNPRIATLISSCQFVKHSGFALKYPSSLKNIFELFLNFDWRDSTKFSLKYIELESAEKFFYAYVQSLIESPLNSLKFLKMIKSY